MRDEHRTEGNKKDIELEYIINLLNNIFQDDEHVLTQNYKDPELPVLLIVGPPRSGTTLLYQWLASTNLFSYPSNLISRFYKVPYIGSLIHKMYVDLDKHNEIFGKSKVNFESELGKTKTAKSPHEFWYFWREFFSFDTVQKLSEEELTKVDKEKFLQQLAALEKSFNKPLLLKALILNWNLVFLNKIFKKAFFIHIQRNEIHNMNSLFSARLKFFGNTEMWYSFKPPEYPELKKLDVYQQLAGQVVYTNKAIQKQFKSIDKNKYININYEEFCQNPKFYFDSIIKKLSHQDFIVQAQYNGPQSFEPKNSTHNKAFEEAKAKLALEKYLAD